MSASHLFDWLAQIGLTESTGMGVSPLSWREISAWSDLTAVRLAPWEARLIRSLSSAYVAESRRAEDEGAVAPYRSGKITAAEVRREVDALRGVLG